MNIKGIYKTTLIDYPGRISAAIFTGGCNLRCRYCHNPSLVIPGQDEHTFSEDDVLDLLKKRKNIIEGLAISGGEPTLNEDLGSFIEKVKELSIDVKLDTNGLNPSMIADLLNRELLDYVALDVKTSPDKYSDLTGRDINFSTIVQSINALRESGVDFEIRTTCIPGFVTIDDFHAIKETIGYVPRYALQQFVADNDLVDNNLRKVQPYPVKILYDFKKFVETFTDVCEIRGV